MKYKLTNQITLSTSNHQAMLIKRAGFTWYIVDIFAKGEIFCDFLFALQHVKPLLKRDLHLNVRICSQWEQQILSF